MTALWNTTEGTVEDVSSNQLVAKELVATAHIVAK